MILSFKKEFTSKILEGTKIHTIRDDKPDRWKKGNKIHFATGVRTSSYSCFKQAVCTRTQSILMTFNSFSPFDDMIEITVDNKSLYTHQELFEFALNDGFEDWESFYNWFYPLIKASPNQEYKGKVIHWTYKKY